MTPLFSNREIGMAGEDLAVKYLKKQKYKIIARNFKTTCEMDIICEKDGVICFVEVKSRTSNKFGMPREAVDALRQERYRNGAVAFLKKFDLIGSKMRFDVIEVQNGEITHIKDAF